jgi:hypothetical protein
MAAGIALAPLLPSRLEDPTAAAAELAGAAPGLAYRR